MANPFDLWILSRLHASHPSFAVYVMVGLTYLGSGWFLFALLPFLRAATTRRATTILLSAVIVSSLVVFVTKKIVGRVRPCACVPGIHALIIPAPTDPSFPSGHAAGAFTVAMFVAAAQAKRSESRLRASLIAISCGAVASGIGISRIVLGVHFPTDVATGALVGCLSGAVAARVYDAPLSARAEA